jgi:hypothetical protein
MALNLGGQSFELSGTKTLVTNEREIVAYISRPGVVSPPNASTVVGQLEQTLVQQAQQPVAVRSAQAVITASMPAAATIAGAAVVRANPGSSNTVLVLDFQGLRTITELAAPSGFTIADINAWLGTKFDDKSVQGFPEGGANAVAFQELQAERLLVTLNRAIDPAAFASGGSVVLPTPPSNLELLVNGTRAFFQQGPIKGTQFTATVDLTAAVTAAAATGDAVTVTFRAAAPASLTLDASAELLQRYPVVFPEAAARTVEAPTEGVYPLLLPVQHAAITTPQWFVRCVVVDISAKLPATRVIPADGPQLSTDAELVLDPDHAIVVGLPISATASLGTLTGVRLPVVVDAAGAELAGTLLAATASGEPGDPIPKGALGPVTLQPSTSTDAAWIDLALTTPKALKGSEIVWLEVQAARGSVVWKVAVPPAHDSDAAHLRRKTSSGRYVPLSTLAGVPYTGAMRVVGQERANDPLAAVLVSATGAGVSGTVAGVPTQAGTTMAVVLQPPVPFTAPTDADPDFSLDLTISAPGSYAITAAELQYTTQ